MTKPVTYTVTEEWINTILSRLGDQPARCTMSIILLIQQECARQNKEENEKEQQANKVTKIKEAKKA